MITYVLISGNVATIFDLDENIQKIFEASSNVSDYMCVHECAHANIHTHMVRTHIGTSTCICMFVQSYINM